MKRTFLLLMSCLLIFSLVPSALAFSDNASPKSSSLLEALKRIGAIIGSKDNVSGPEDKLTYASGVSLIVEELELSLARFLFIREPVASDYFDHIRDDHPDANAFVIAKVNGLDIPRDVEPSRHITREEFAHLLMQAVDTHGERAYILPYLILEDEADVNPAYMGNIQRLLITRIAPLGQDNKFHPTAVMTRKDAESWLRHAVEFIRSTPEIPDAGSSPFYDMKLEVQPVNDQVNKVTVSAQAPHPGYGIRIASIEFAGKQAIIHVAPILPDPDMMYPQVIVEVAVDTYIGAEYEPVLAGQTQSDSLANQAGQ